METVAIIHTLPSKGITVSLSENFTAKSVLLYLLFVFYPSTFQKTNNTIQLIGSRIYFVLSP